tara:strand:+ start:173 stop:544 length:372 start_codon:yes stop_codon:yes gene_type:complete
MAKGRFLTLKNDKDAATVLIVGEPESRQVKGDFGLKTEFLFPIIHDGELKVYAANKRSYPELVEHRDKFLNHSVTITRRGKKGAQSTIYLFDVKPDTDLDTKARQEVCNADVVQMFEDLIVPF